jgi:hypothetical protein
MAWPWLFFFGHCRRDRIDFISLVFGPVVIEFSDIELLEATAYIRVRREARANTYSLLGKPIAAVLIYLAINCSFSSCTATNGKSRRGKGLL